MMGFQLKFGATPSHAEPWNVALYVMVVGVGAHERRNGRRGASGTDDKFHAAGLFECRGAADDYLAF